MYVATLSPQNQPNAAKLIHCGPQCKWIKTQHIQKNTPKSFLIWNWILLKSRVSHLIKYTCHLIQNQTPKDSQRAATEGGLSKGHAEHLMQMMASGKTRISVSRWLQKIVHPIIRGIPYIWHCYFASWFVSLWKWGIRKQLNPLNWTWKPSL